MATQPSPLFIAWFETLCKEDVARVGGKAAARCVAETETRLAGGGASAAPASEPDRPSITNLHAAAEEAN